MNDLTRSLYEFVQERRMGTIYGDPEYAEASRGVELQLKKVQRALGEDNMRQTELQLLLESISAQNSIENEHLFQAVLRLVRELEQVGAE